MRFLISILLLFSIKLASAQSVVWVKSFEMDGMDFQNHSILKYNSENILVGVKAIDSTSTAYYENELYAYAIDDNSNQRWSIKFKPLDSVNCSEIVVFNSNVIDSFLIIVGSCYLNSIRANVYYYATLNLNTQEVKSYNIGRVSFINISSIAVEDNKLVLFKTLNATSAGELLRIDVNTNIIITKPINLPFASKLYLNHNFYVVKDSTTFDNKIILLLSKIDTNGNVVASSTINTNLISAAFGFVYVGITIRNGNVFVSGTYEYHLSNPTIQGYINDSFIIKIDINTLQKLQFFALSYQFPNEIKSKQEIKFDSQGDNTFIIAKVINDNNLRNVYSFLLNNNGVVWTKKLTEPSLNQFHKRFVQGDIVNQNNFTVVLSSFAGEVTILNYTYNGTMIDSIVTMLDTESKSLDVLNAIVLKNDNSIYLTGTHVLMSETKERLYLSKLNFIKNSSIIKSKTLIKVYPNPATNIATISIDNIKEVHLYNTLGEKIKAYYNTNSLNTEDLPHGIYSLKIITSSNDVYTQKLIVAK